MAKKVNKWIRKFMSKQGFTLVELIIVIAVIAILAVAAFMMLTKWLSASRDSRRLGDVSVVKKALQISVIDPESTGLYPMPDADDDLGGVVATGTINWQILTYRWVVGSWVVSSMDELTQAPRDPSDNTQYILYGITANRKEYQVGVRLEKYEEQAYFQEVYASDSIPYVDGEYDGLIVYLYSGATYVANIPSLLYTFSGSMSVSGVDLLADKYNIYPIIKWGKNLPYTLWGETLSDIQIDDEDASMEVLYGSGASLTWVNIQGIIDGTETFDDIFTGTTLDSFGWPDNKSVLATTIEEKSGTPIEYTPTETNTGSSTPTNTNLCTFGNIILDNTSEGNCILQ